MKNQKGFTLPELVIVLGVSGTFVALVLFFGISYWRYGLTLSADSDTLVTRLNVQDYLRENLGASSGLIIQNGIQDNTALNPDTTVPGNKYWIPLHAVPTTFTPTGTGTTPLIYYKKMSVNTSGNFVFNGSLPYEDEFVMYMDNAESKLYIRSIANPSAASNRLKTSCPPASATTACPSDKLIATDLKTISTRYFSRSGNLLDWTSVVDSITGKYIGPDYPSVEVVEFTVKLAQRPGLEKSKTTQNTTVIRIALRNT